MSDKKFRIVFAGTPEFAAESLAAILAADPTQSKFEIIAVYTQPDRPSGRGRKLTPSPVKAVALANNIGVNQPASFKEEGAIGALAWLQPDLMIVAAYGLILPKAVLDIPRLGCINIHASLLPRWRGAAPIQRAIQAGDDQTGITIMQMDVGLDTGDMLLKRAIPITAEDTGGILHDKLAKLGAEAIIDYLQQRLQGPLPAEPQNAALANYAHKLSKDESAINWHDNAASIARCVRAFNPWPVSYTQDQGERIRILAATAIPSNSDKAPGTVIIRDKSTIAIQCGENALSVELLQLPGGKPLTVNELINGGKPFLQANSQLG
jgi:methionyl-tRNA formyltransferase